jgi:hypothetical protein
MISEREPASLVAALLSLIEDEAHSGFDIPDVPKTEPRREKKNFPPRPGEKPGWTPGSRPVEIKSDRPAQSYKKPSGTFEDRAHGPRKGLSPFKRSEDRNPVDRRTGKPFKKKG